MEKHHFYFAEMFFCRQDEKTYFVWKNNVSYFTYVSLNPMQPSTEMLDVMLSSNEIYLI